MLCRSFYSSYVFHSIFVCMCVCVFCFFFFFFCLICYFYPICFSFMNQTINNNTISNFAITLSTLQATLQEFLQVHRWSRNTYQKYHPIFQMHWLFERWWWSRMNLIFIRLHTYNVHVTVHISKVTLLYTWTITELHF